MQNNIAIVPCAVFNLFVVIMVSDRTVLAVSANNY